MYTVKIDPWQNVESFKARKNQGLVCYINISSLGWTFKEQMAVYSPIRPTAIKGKFTVGKGKYVNMVYSFLQTSAFETVTRQNIC